MLRISEFYMLRPRLMIWCVILNIRYYISPYGYDLYHLISTIYIYIYIYICRCLLFELMLDIFCVEAPRTYMLCICIQMQITCMHTCRGSASMFCQHDWFLLEFLLQIRILSSNTKKGEIERTSLTLCFGVFDVNICDTLMFDEVVQR